MPLAVASSKEAAEFSQAQLVRCGRGFRPTHIRVQYLASGSVSDTHGENGQGKRESMESWRFFFVLHKETVVEMLRKVK